MHPVLFHRVQVGFQLVAHRDMPRLLRAAPVELCGRGGSVAASTRVHRATSRIQSHAGYCLSGDAFLWRFTPAKNARQMRGYGGFRNDFAHGIGLGNHDRKPQTSTAVLVLATGMPKVFAVLPNSQDTGRIWHGRIRRWPCFLCIAHPSTIHQITEPAANLLFGNSHAVYRRSAMTRYMRR
jgi:hypothetical protein